jgi:hypothetical protein
MYVDAVEEPLLYTVLEAAKQLHIGRTLAYQQAERYLATNGRDGIPAIKIGNCLRVPRPDCWLWRSPAESPPRPSSSPTSGVC